MKEYRVKTNEGTFSTESSTKSSIEDWIQETLNDGAKEGFELEQITTITPSTMGKDDKSFFSVLTIIMSKEIQN